MPRRSGFRKRLAWPRSRVVRVAILVVVIVLAIPYVLAPIYRFVDPVSTLMLWRWARHERVVRHWTPLDRFGPEVPLAVIAAEDAHFCSHHGVDFGQLREVIREIDGFSDLADLRGGSTITQQVAKNLFLWQGHSFVRKALEFPLAFWVDLVVGKRRVLEIYLNVVEWGPNGEFGAEAAARRAFNTPARDLERPEAALLAAVLPNPLKRDPRAPKPGLRRLAGIYQGRMAEWAFLGACLRRRGSGN